MWRANTSAFKLWLGAGTLAAVLAGESHAQQVGTASAVNPQAQAGSRVLHIGSNIVFRERVSTTSAGSVQIVFVDKTTLNVGPNSNVVIDEFVYNPNTGTGRMTVSLAKGAVRVVGGNVAHTGGATVKTPVATIGVRGGTTTITHDKQTRAINHFGIATITRGQSTVMLKRPEFATTVSGTQMAPRAPSAGCWRAPPARRQRCGPMWRRSRQHRAGRRPRSTLAPPPRSLWPASRRQSGGRPRAEKPQATT